MYAKFEPEEQGANPGVNTCLSTVGLLPGHSQSLAGNIGFDQSCQLRQRPLPRVGGPQWQHEFATTLLE